MPVSKHLQHITSPEVREFIQQNTGVDIHAFLLKKSPFAGISIQELAQQIKGRQVAAKKFPFLNVPEALFPTGLSLEQSSSEATAKYKASLAKPGHTFLDLTAGFGVDAYFLAEKFEEATLVEQNAELLETVEHNWQILNIKADFVNSSLEFFLQENERHFDLIFLDPARRDASKRKVFLLEDLSPDFLSIQDELFEITDRILLKLSPLIDITYLTEVLKNIAEIHIVAVKNDVKELLVLMDVETTAVIKVTAVNLETDEPDFTFYLNNKTAVADYSPVQKYLYIPNNAVMKTGAFSFIAHNYQLKKLHPNTHFYTSDAEIPQFPGRIFEVEQVRSDSLKKGSQYHVISKNYPLKPEQLRKKYKLKDGGNQFLIFTEDVCGKIILKSVV